MPSALFFLLAGIAFAAILSVVAWVRHRGPRSPVGSAERFERAMRAIAPDDDDRA